MEFWRTAQLMEARIVDAYAKVGSVPEEDELVLSNYLEGKRIPLAACCAPSLTRDKIEHLAAKHLLTLPLKLAVANKADRRDSCNAEAHAVASLRDIDEFIYIEPGLAVASPALCVVTGARGKDLIASAISIAKACSPYIIDKSFIHIGKRSLTSKAEVYRCTEQLQGSSSVILRSRAKTVLNTIPFVSENLYSPREIALQLLLCLPKRIGGFGLPVPTANKILPLNKKQRALCDRSYLLPDLLWENAALDVEYNGYEFHSSSAQIESDRTRKAALATMGFEVIEVDSLTLSSISETRKIATRIARRNGIELETRGPSFDEKHIMLRSRLLHPSSLDFSTA